VNQQQQQTALQQRCSGSAGERGKGKREREGERERVSLLNRKAGAKRNMRRERERGGAELALTLLQI